MSRPHEVQDAIHARRTWPEYEELCAKHGVAPRHTRDEWFDLTPMERVNATQVWLQSLPERAVVEHNGDHENWGLF